MSTQLDICEGADRRGHGAFEYLSASRLNLWLRCPLAFKLRYVDGIPTPTTPSLFLGKRVHDGLEHFYRHRQLGIHLEADDVTKRITDSWDEAIAAEDMQFASLEDSASLRQKAVNLITVYINQVPRDEPKPLAVETSLEFALADPTTGEDFGMPLVGVVDLVLEGDDGLTIADFKTAGNSTPPLEVAHEIQLSCYAYLFRQMTGQQESGLQIRSLIKTKTPKIAFHQYDARSSVHFQRLFAVIRAYLDDLDAGRFIYRPGWGCSMCEYRETHCRSWSGRINTQDRLEIEN